jgi:hypothetical protein
MEKNHSINARVIVWFKMIAIRKALQRPAPSAIPLSDIIKTRERNYSLVYISSASHFVFLCQDTVPEGIIGTVTGHEPMSACVPYCNLSYFDMRITRYFGEIELEYTSPLIYILHWYTAIPRYLLLRERIASFLYGKKTLARVNRMKILKHFIDHTIESPDFVCTPVSLATTIYGNRWVSHPDVDRTIGYYSLLLQSLESSSDLEKVRGGGYRLLPKGLVTLSVSEDEDRKHNDNVKIQQKMVVLTAALTLMALLQLFHR